MKIMVNYKISHTTYLSHTIVFSHNDKHDNFTLSQGLDALIQANYHIENSILDNHNIQSLVSITINTIHKPRQLIRHFCRANSHYVVLLKHLILQKVQGFHT